VDMRTAMVNTTSDEEDDLDTHKSKRHRSNDESDSEEESEPYYHRRGVPGVVGLSNLGNTCFMNSALQCLTHAAPLTEYFISDEYKKEINYNNPLGMKGEIAVQYGKLIQRMWSGKTSSLNPSDFKWAVGRFAPRFSGFRQQDSQELLAFLLDGLHEDLNRVLNKPYVEKQDYAGEPDAELAATAWEDHLKRNKSVVVEYFQGLLKSTLWCPNDACGQSKSIKFDPYMYLSLPLPRVTQRVIKVLFYPYDPSKPLLILGLVVEKHGKVNDLRIKISEKVGCEPNKLLMADVYHSRILSIYHPNRNVSAVKENDKVVAYELPPTPEDDDNNKDGEKSKLEEKIQQQDSKKREVCLRVTHSITKLRDSISNISYSLPLVIGVSKGMTNKDLYNKLFKHSRRFLVDPRKNTDTNAQNSSSTDMSDEEMFNSDPWTYFSIHLTHSSLLKKIEPNDEECTLRNAQAITITWNKRGYFCTDKQKKMIVKHESAQTQLGNKEKIKLTDCLEQYIMKEQLGEGDEWYCPKCKERVLATKKFDIWSLPEVLVIHLKRFIFTRRLRDKIDSFVDYPIEGLDLTKYVRSHTSDEPVYYDLFAVSVHSGGLGGGHYTAYAMNHKNNKWYHFNDSWTNDVLPERVKVRGAYLLFYRKRNTGSSNTSEKTKEQQNGTPMECD